MSSGQERALVACGGFGLIAVAGWSITATDPSIAIPLGLYYATLVINTYFSIKTFASITPASRTQNSIDLGIAALYCTLAFSFGSTTQFGIVACILFIAAIIKYLHARYINIGMPKLIRRKLILNSLAALLAAGVAADALMQDAAQAAWILAIVFGIANIYVLMIAPMYRLDK